VPLASGGAVSATTLFFLRMAIAFPFFAAVAWWLRGRAPRIGPREWIAIGALGLTGYYAASYLDFVGLKYVGAGVGRLILYVYPTIVVVLSLAFLGKRPSGRELVALGVTYAGIALVVSGQPATASEGGPFLFGAALVFGSALCYAVYLVAGSALVQRIGSMRFTAWTMIVSTIPAVAQFPALEPASALDLPAAVWGYAALIAMLCTVLPVFLVAEALRRIGANQFALIGAVGPVSVAITSALGLDEPFTGWQAAGGALVIAGVLLVSLKPGARTPGTR
jgi:drug/metabolite transporter (DMT)-like permease